MRLDDDLAGRLYRAAKGDRWDVARDAFADALARSATKAFGDRVPAGSELERYLAGLHLEDLALACACAAGHEGAWERVIREHRPALYRAAAAIDPTGGARDLADSLYAELFGLKDTAGARQSLFRYFHGRSSLATWLRSILAQRHIDGIRSHRRLEPLPDEEPAAAPPAASSSSDPDRPRFAVAMLAALTFVIGRLAPRDRLRLGWYYAQQMTLAEIGRLLKEHEATVSRHLSRTRRAIRDGVDQRLREHHGFVDREVSECFASIAADAGPIDLAAVLADENAGKIPVPDRSTHERMT